MTCFEMWLQIASTAGTVGAVVVGIWAITSSISSNRKQTRIGKIEEMSEITTFLFYYYDALVTANNKHDAFNNPDVKGEEKTRLEKEHENYLRNLKAETKSDGIAEKTIRLKTLANAYLDGETRLKVLSYCGMFENLMMVALQKDIIKKATLYKEGYPNALELFKFLTEIQNDFVKRISMSKSPVNLTQLDHYRENDFKQQLKLKKK